jgi:uncharacterized protein involved in exopolysaccharide biosynthesis
VTSGVEERIALIRQRLTARQTLLDVAERLDVFRDRPGLPPGQIVDEMRAATTMQGVTLGRRRGPVTSIQIGYLASDPRIAAAVDNEFVSLLLEENIRQRNQQALGTVGFFDREVDRLNRDLTAAEAELARFKTENRGALPETFAARQSELLSLRDRIYEREIQRAAYVQRLSQLQQVLAGGGVDLAGVESTEETELRRLNAALVEARSVYADSHPRVRLLTSRIGVLQASLAQAGARAADPAPTAGGLDPAQRLREAIVETETALAQLDDRDARDAARIAVLEEGIAATPDVELRLNALNRSYASLQARHAEAVTKRAQAEIGERLEINQQAERLEVVEQAQTPRRPESPNRALIVAIAGGGGLALGFGLVTLLELLNRTIRSPAELERAANLRAFATIPYIVTAREVTQRRRMLRFAAVFAVLAVPLAGYVVNRYVAPLPGVLQQTFDWIGAQAQNGRTRG